MVGYAYSVDRTCGYNYYLIKCYDTENISFITDYMPYCVYRVSRRDGKVSLAYSSPAYSGKRLRLKIIEEITSYLILSEHERNFPVSMEWTETPSGICNKGRAADLYISFPLSPNIIEKETSYINITTVCFKNRPSLLDVTFLCDILNEALYHLGIYESEAFTVCGNQIFCTKYTAALAKKIFSQDIFNLTTLKTVDKTRVKLKRIKKLNLPEFSRGEYSPYDNKNLVVIKRECMEEVLNILNKAISGRQGFKRTYRELYLCIAKTLSDIKGMSLTFLSKSGASKSTDINYISFDYLMTIFNFPISHTKTREVIRLNKERTSRMREFDIPDAYYNGDLISFFNKC